MSGHVPTTWDRTAFILFEDRKALKHRTGTERQIKAPEMRAFPVSRPKQAPDSRRTGAQAAKTALFFRCSGEKSEGHENRPITDPEDTEPSAQQTQDSATLSLTDSSKSQLAPSVSAFQRSDNSSPLIRL